MFLSKIVSPKSIVSRSVNIERDLEDETTLLQYILTEKGADIINRFVSAMMGEKISAWSLTGPYGMGKSSFVNFILALCGPQNTKYYKVSSDKLNAFSFNLKKQYSNALAKLNNGNKGFFRVAATASFESINRTLTKALLKSIMQSTFSGKRKEDVDALTFDIKTFLDNETSDTGQLLQYIKKTGELYGTPIAIVIDEFGKNLEYMAQNAGKGDLYILQALAESKNIFIWVCLHQSFEEYASELSKKQIQEWGKIQGRFEDISFIEPHKQMIQFIRQTLVKINGANKFSDQIKNWAESYFKKFSTIDIIDPDSINFDIIRDCYPLHPLVAYTLPDLCIRFAQNDRTLFAFLCGGSPYALPHYLNHQKIEPKKGELSAFGVAALYDYFLAVTNTISMNRPESKRWFEVNSILDDSRHLPTIERQVLKVIGLLNLLAKPSGIRASRDILAFACYSPMSPDSIHPEKLMSILDDLIGKGLVIYRKYADEYRLWEGSDIDISEAMKEYRAKLKGVAMDEMLEKVSPLSPIIAARHSYKTGTMRYFERRWISVDNLDQKFRCYSEDADGLLLQCFGEISMPTNIPKKTIDGKPIILAYVACEKKLNELIIEASATKSMLAESPELSRDGVARKEARFRAQMAEKKLRKTINLLFSPKNSSMRWYSGQKPSTTSSNRALSAYISSLCDKAYRDCPIIRNELINRNKLSSATARARRELIEAMVTHEARIMLNFEGTGPEVAIYRTMLLATGVHQNIKEGSLQFVMPGKDSTYYPAWTAIDKTIKEEGDREVSLEVIVDILQKPPIGMKYGPIPILICLFLIVNSDTIALYRENSFIPYLTPVEMELMVKRPELFTLKRFAPTGVRSEIFQIYRELLNSTPVVGENQIRNVQMVSVVAPLVNFANNLSDYVKKTKTISQKARSALRVLLAAKDPIPLLFEDLPNAIGCGNFSDTDEVEGKNVAEFHATLRSVILELSQADQVLLETIKESFYDAIESDLPLKILREDLKTQAAPLVNRCANIELKSFLKILNKPTEDHDAWLIALATVVTKKPVDSWNDNDIQIFKTRIHDLIKRFQSLEALVTAELHLPEQDQENSIWQVSMMDSHGNMPNRILRVKKESMEKAQSYLPDLYKKYAQDELKALFVLLSEKMLNADDEQEGSNEKK